MRVQPRPIASGQRRAGGPWSWRLFRAALLVALLLLCASAVRADVVDRVLAIVDGRLVTLSDVRAVLSLQLIVPPPGADAVEQAVERWIERVLVLQEVDRFAPPEPAAAAIDARTGQVLGAPGDPSSRRGRLTALGVDEAWVSQWIRDDLRIQSYIEQRFAGAMEPTSEELENYYREHRSEFAADGRELSAAESEALARDRVMSARRRVLVNDWLDGLKRRADIVRTRPRP